MAESFEPGAVKGAWALAATAGYLPLHLRHVGHFVRGTRPRHGGWTLLAMTVMIVGVLPLAGTLWLPSFHALLVSALIVLRPPWSLAAAAAVVLAQAPLAVAVGSDLIDAPSYYTLTVIWRASSGFVPLWLVASIRQLQEARRQLAEEAVVRERVRIDAELRQTLGTALDAIVDRGGRAGAQVGRDERAVERELRDLVDRARRALADARQLVTGFQQGSLRAEGVRTRVVLPAGALPTTMDDSARTALRTATARVLRDDTVPACVITVIPVDGRAELHLRREDAEPPTRVGTP